LQQRLGADRLDPPFVGIMSNGTSGDINNINFRQAGSRNAPYEQMRHVAAVVGDAAHQVLQSVEYRDRAKLAARESTLRLGRRLPRQPEIERARFLLSQTKGQPQLTRLEEIYARETVLMADWPPEIEIILQVIRVGDLCIFAIPCEVFVELGLALKKESPFQPSFTISLANGYAGYLPTEAQHELGGYETWRARSSFLEKQAEPKIRQRLLRMAKELA
jgi:hypothetical protein